MSFTQYLTYQHNVQRYFREHRDKYDGVIVPLSIAVSFPSGTYGFIRALCASDETKQYAIDPRSALFQKHWDRSHVREPHKKMVEVFGEPFESRALTRALTPEDFQDNTVVGEMVDRWLRFQDVFRTSEDDQRKLNKYKKLLGLTMLSDLGEPQFIIPPYFQFDDIGDAWYAVSQRCTELAAESGSGIPLRPVIHFAGWRADQNWVSCFSWLKDQRIQGAWLYPNDFHEHQASDEDLTEYVRAVISAMNTGITPYSLFGGYFALLLSYFGLQGFGNGIGYGEWRDSGYHKGGTASTRVYLLKLHRFLDAPAAQALIEQAPDYFGEDTDILAGYIAAEKSLDSMTLQESLDHFMECRTLEMEFVENQPLPAAVEELRNTVARLDDMPLERRTYGNSLATWASVLAAANS